MIATAAVSCIGLVAAAAHYVKMWLASKAKIGIASVATPGVQTAGGDLHPPGRDDDNNQQPPPAPAAPTTTPGFALPALPSIDASALPSLDALETEILS